MIFWARGLLLTSSTWHDDVIKWKHFPRYWPFVRGIHRSPVNSPHKGQWCGALMFPLICAWINALVNTREAGDLRRHPAYFDVIVMKQFAQNWNSTSTETFCHVSSIQKYLYTSIRREQPSGEPFLPRIDPLMCRMCDTMQFVPIIFMDRSWPSARLTQRWVVGLPVRLWGSGFATGIQHMMQFVHSCKLPCCQCSATSAWKHVLMSSPQYLNTYIYIVIYLYSYTV